MASSRKWARLISRIASRMYFSIIILQVPLFRVPCSSGSCTAPLVVTSSHLAANEILPATVTEILLYPGAVANAVVTKVALPSYDNLLKQYHFEASPLATSHPPLEVLIGSYLCVIGAFLGILKPGRVGLIGSLLVVWGLFKKDTLRRPSYVDAEEVTSIYPSMFVAVTFAFMSIRGDVRKIIRSCRTGQPDPRKPPWNHSEAKLE